MANEEKTAKDSPETSKSTQQEGAPNEFKAHRKRTTFNLKLALSLIVGVLVFGVGVHFLHAFQVDRNADSLLSEAKDAQAEGELQKAAQYYRTYISFRPDDAEAIGAYAELLDSLAKDGNGLRRAYFTYEQALRIDITREDWRMRSAEIAMALGRYTDALAHIKTLEKKSQQDLKLSLLAGRCYLANGEISESAKRYLNVLAADETNVDAYTTLADMFLRYSEELPKQQKLEDNAAPKSVVATFPMQAVSNEQGEAVYDQRTNEERVEQLLEVLVQKGEPKYRTFLERARFRIQNNQLSEADTDIQKALELAANNSDVLLAAAQLEISKAKEAKQADGNEIAAAHFAKATEYAKKGLALPEPNPFFYMAIYEVEMLNQNLDEAQQAVQSGMDAVEKLLEETPIDQRGELNYTSQVFQMTSIDLLITYGGQLSGSAAEKKLSQADESLKDFKTKVRESWITLYLESRLHVARREWNQAIPKLERARNLLASANNVSDRLARRRLLDLNIGLCYQKLSNPDRQIVVFRRAITEDPLWLAARLELARALRTANRQDEAIKLLRTMGGVPGAPLELAQLLLIQESQKSEAEQNWNLVEQAIAAEIALREQKGFPSTPGIQSFRAELSLLQGRRDEAQKLLDQARIDHPDNPGIVAVQVSLILSDLEVANTERVQEAKNVVENAEATMGDSLELRSAKAQIARNMAPLEAESLLSSLQTGLESWDLDDIERLMYSIASSYKHLGDIEGEKQTWLKLAELDPESLLSRIQLVQIANSHQDDSLKKKHLPKLVEIEGNGGPIGNVVRAHELVNSIKPQDGELNQSQREKLIQARELLNQAGSQRAIWPLVPTLLGRVEGLLGNNEIAFEHYRNAVALGEQSTEVIGIVVQELYNKKRFDEADRILQESVSKDPTLLNGALARLASGIAWQRNQTAQSMELMEATAEESNDFRDLVLLSRMRQALNEPQERVDQPLKDAIQRFEKKPEPWLALVAHLERTNRIEEAEETLKNAQQKLSKFPEHLIPLTLARGYELIENLEKASQYYQEAFDTNPENSNLQSILADYYSRHGKYDQAVPLLKSLTSADSDASPELKEWARSRTARTIASSGNYKDIQKALKIIDESSSGPSGTSLFNLRTKAEMLAARTTKAHHRERIKIFETISERGDINNDEQLILARLYGEVGSWEKSRQTFEALLNDLPDADLLMVEFSHALVRHDDIDEAKKWLERARLKSPNTFAVMRLEATILNKTKGIDAAEEAVNAYLTDDSVITSAQTVQNLLTDRDGQTVLRDFSKTLENKEPDEHAKFVEGTRFLSDGQVVQAIQKFLPFLSREDLKTQVRAYFYRKASRLFGELGAHDKAESYYRKAMEIAERPSDQLELISILARQNRLKDALDLCDELWQQDSDTLAAKTSVAVLRTGKPTKKEIQRVESKLTTAMKKSSTPDQILMHIADLKDLAGEHDQSILFYEQILKKNPRNLVALNNFAYLSVLAGKDPKRALDAINTAIEVVGPIAAMLDTRGVVYLKNGEINKAIQDLTQAVDELPSVSSQFRLAQAYMEKGDKKKASALFKDAEEDGLSAKELHPLEVEDFEKVAKSLKTKT